MTDANPIEIARPEDAHGIARIYAHYVENGSATFEFDPPDAAQMAGRIEKVLADGVRTADLMGPQGGTPVSTSEMGDKIVAALAEV